MLKGPAAPGVINHPSLLLDDHVNVGNSRWGDPAGQKIKTIKIKKIYGDLIIFAKNAVQRTNN